MKINAHQSVGEAVLMMKGGEIESLPVYLHGAEMGSVSYNELIHFLGDPDDSENVYFHKLNFNVGIALQILRDRTIHEEIKEEEKKQVKAQKIFKLWAIRLSAAAAIAILFFGLAWAYINKTDRSAETKPVNKEVLTLKTGYRETKKLQLPDGSILLLNAVSQLSYPGAFSKTGENEIFLSGEAFIKPSPGSKTTLVIRTGKKSFRFEGDSLNVKAYPEEGQVNTIFNGNVTEQGIQNAIAWTKGNFVFHEERLESVMKQVARWYGIKVIYQNNKAQNILIGATISRSIKLKELLSSLELTQDVHFKIKNDYVIVSN